MVLLAMSPQLAAVVNVYLEHNTTIIKSESNESNLHAPTTGNPISHDQIIEISKYLQSHEDTIKDKMHDGQPLPTRLADLLRGCSLYIQPPKPKTEPTNEYKLLMARLRAEEEARQYDRMINPPTQSNVDLFSQRYPRAKYGDFNTTSNGGSTSEEEEMTYADVNRQLALIANVLISIVCCAVAIWIAARRWSTPSRLFLSMGGSLLVAVAEVVIYTGYIRRLTEAKSKERKKVERKSISESFVIEGRKGGKRVVKEKPLKVVGLLDLDGDGSSRTTAKVEVGKDVRRRKG